jgi:formamidopyrimidine-DNA glycosylase
LELPEINLLSRDMNRELTGKRITELEVENVKCLNQPLDVVRAEVIGRRILRARPRGKWVFIELEGDNNLLYNTGMGANTIYYPAGNPPGEKRHIRVGLDDGSGFTSQVWWFCYLHLIKTGDLRDHKMTTQLGPAPMEDAFTPEYLGSILKNRGAVKNTLLDQKKVAGIGNVYIHDPLFLASIHPLRAANTVTDDEVDRLHAGINKILDESIKMGGLAYEVNFYGVKGGYGKPQYRVAYKEGEPCPTCGTTIQKIKTGATSSYICPRCQPR